MSNLTNNEKILLKNVLVSNFNGDVIDLNKKWENQCLEESERFISIVDIKKYAFILKMEVNAAKGVLGSLVKKEMICIMEDEDGDGRPMSWLMINEDNFNKIKEVLNN